MRDRFRRARQKKLSGRETPGEAGLAQRAQPMTAIIAGTFSD
jgi:hypothetical protein